MKLERSDVGLPIWRKNVDKGSSTTVQQCQSGHAGCGNSRKLTVASQAKRTRLRRLRLSSSESYDVWVTTGPHGRGSPAFRLWFDEALSLELKHAFLMKYVRSPEGTLTGEADVEALSIWRIRPRRARFSHCRPLCSKEQQPSDNRAKPKVTRRPSRSAVPTCARI